MFQRKAYGTIIVLLLSVSIAVAVGCSSPSQGEKMVQSFAKTREILADSTSHVDVTLVRLSGLRNTPAGYLSDAFRQYKESVNQLEQEGKDSKWRADTLKEEADAHIAAWQREMEDIKDPMIKASLESRRQAVRSNFKLVQMYAQDARKAYEPFLRGNKEIVQALSIDLSPAALTSLAPSIDRVTSDGQALKERLAAMQRALDNIAHGVSPLGE